MKRVLRGLLICGLMCLMAALMSGCGLFKSIDSLYALPALPDEYSQLQSSIQKVKDDLSAEYAVISYGSYTSTIQLLDMDNDGVQETAAVFLRVNTTGEKPLRVCMFRRGGDGKYKLSHTVEGDGLSINSVTYEDLTGDGVRELIVSWQIAAGVNTLSAYQFATGAVHELMSTSYNEGYLTVDLNEDRMKEIVVFQRSSSDTEGNRAEYYRYQEGTMLMVSAAPLSASIKNVIETTESLLQGGASGIYVSSEVENGVLTDILTLKETELVNVTLNAEIGQSQTTMRTYTEVGAVDINLDGVIEVPLPVLASALDPTVASNQHIIYWRQFDNQGISTVVSATYHSVTDGWYLRLPNNWLGNITVARDDSRSIRGERAVVFYYWPDTETTTPVPFLTIYRLTGENRYTRSKLTGRTTLLSDSSAIYSASLAEEIWDCGLKVSELGTIFNLITIEWSTQ